MKTLIKTEMHDDSQNFMIELADTRGVKNSYEAKLFRDYKKVGDGVYWALKNAACIKSRYTQADTDHQNRLDSLEAVVDGEVVLIDGEEYVTKVNGLYSDCAVFEKI